MWTFADVKYTPQSYVHDLHAKRHSTLKLERARRRRNRRIFAPLVTVRNAKPPRVATERCHARALVLGATAVATLLILFADVAAGQAPTPPITHQSASRSGNAELETITVEARRRRTLLDDQVSVFVSSIANAPKHESLARWQVPICLLVAGLPRARGETVLDRILQVATNARAPLAPPECAPNLFVVMSHEPESLLRKWWGEDHKLFSRDRGLGGVERLVDSDVPVRVWHNALSHGALGSRLSWGTTRVIYSAIVVVDLRRVEGLNDRQVADYVAIVGLAQIRENPELGEAPTILRLFTDADLARPQCLSKWDEAFLKSLYATDSSNKAQVSQMKLRMSEDLAR